MLLLQSLMKSSVLTHSTSSFAWDVFLWHLEKSSDQLVLIRNGFVHVQIFVICDKEIADEVLLGSVLMRKSEKKPPFNVIDVGETIEMFRSSPLWFVFRKGVFCPLRCVRLHVWAVLWCFTCYFQLTFNCFPQFLEAPICFIMASLCSRCVFSKKALLSSLCCSCYRVLCLSTSCFKAFWWCTWDYFVSCIVDSGYKLQGLVFKIWDHSHTALLHCKHFCVVLKYFSD